MTRAEALAIVKRTPMANAAYQIKTHHVRIPAVVDANAATQAQAKSPETDFRRADMHELRRAFPDRWGHFCRRHFLDAEHLAAFMDVEERTARYWLEGKHAPAAAFVLRAVVAFPDAVELLSAGER